MNKTELVKSIASKAKLKLSDTEKMVNAFIETVSEEAGNKGKVTLVGFGTFSVSHRKVRNGRTGPRSVPGFEPGKALKGQVK
jgi:DNA-binding protein HU-beta